MSQTNTLNPFLEIAALQAGRIGSAFEWHPMPFPLLFLDKFGRPMPPLEKGASLVSGKLVFHPHGLIWWVSRRLDRGTRKIAIMFPLALMKAWPNMEATNEH